MIHSKVVDKYTKCTNEKFAKIQCQDEDPAEAEVVDVTEEWMESIRCIDNVQFDFQGPSGQDPHLAVPSS